MAVFQFKKTLNYPVFIKVDLEKYDSRLKNFLGQMAFTRLDPQAEQEIEQDGPSDPKGRILTLSIASPLVARQINEAGIGPNGAESIIPKEGYRVYRYKGQGLLVYSAAVNTWTLGCFKDFGVNSDFDIAYRVILARYLSWALVHLGVIGFWGIKIDSGAVILRQSQSSGEFIFFDVAKMRVFTTEETLDLPPDFKIYRPSITVGNKNKSMRNEELLSFLSLHCTLFDSDLLSVPARQLIQAISQTIQGKISPKEELNLGSDLSM